MSYFLQIDSSAGLKLEPDTSPYTGTTLVDAASVVDGMWDDTTDVADWDTAYSYGIDLGSQKAVDRLFFTIDRVGDWRTPSSSYAAFSVYKSDDNSTWTFVEIFYAPAFVWKSDGTSGINLNLSSTQTARYFKIVNVGTSTITISSAGYYACEVGQIIAYKEESGDDPTIRIGVSNKWALDPSNTHSDLTLSNNNLTITNTVDDRRSSRCNQPLPSAGKWYWEVIYTEGYSCSTAEGTQRKCIGIGTADTLLSTTIGYNDTSWAVSASGHNIHDSTLTGSVLMPFCGYASTYNHVIGVAYDADTGSLYVKFHTWGHIGFLSDPVTGTNPIYMGITDTVYPMLSLSKNGDQMTINFGEDDFVYPIPEGFEALPNIVSLLHCDDVERDSISITGSYLRNGVIKKSYSIIRKHNALTGNANDSQYFNFIGLVCDTFSLSLAAGDLIKGDISFLGKSSTLTQASTYLDNTTDPTETGIMNTSTNVAEFCEDGESTDCLVSSFNMRLSNNLRGRKCLTELGNCCIGVGKCDVSGTIEVYFKNASLYNKYITGEASSVSIRLIDNSGNCYIIDFPKIKFNATTINVGSVDQSVIQSVPFVAIVDDIYGYTIQVSKFNV